VRCRSLSGASPRLEALLLTRETVVKLIRESIEDVNAERGDASAVAFSEDLPLYGVGSPLDSLDFVNFTVGLEERLRQHNSRSPDLAVVLFDDSAGQPFRSVRSLAEYLSSREAS
jgi:hypothetical protein